MSDIIENKVEDLYLEHSQHNDEWLKNCSLCYEDKVSTLAKYKKMIGYNVRKENDEILEIMESQSTHPEEY